MKESAMYYKIQSSEARGEEADGYTSNKEQAVFDSTSKEA